MTETGGIVENSRLELDVFNSLLYWASNKGLYPLPTVEAALTQEILQATAQYLYEQNKRQNPDFSSEIEEEKMITFRETRFITGCWQNVSNQRAQRLFNNFGHLLNPQIKSILEKLTKWQDQYPRTTKMTTDVGYYLSMLGYNEGFSNSSLFCLT